MKADPVRSIGEVLAQDVAELRAALALAPDEARIEVQCLLQYVLGVPRSYLLAHPEEILERTIQDRYGALLARRLRGEPIAHLLGEREFFGLPLKVTPDTLIPRPDTELLVEQALLRMPQGRTCRVLDLGTGSGAVALSIAHARKDAEVLAVDVSEGALQVARENAQRLGIRNATFLPSDWFSALDGQRFDLIVSNPPYIAAGDEHLTRGDLRFEPLSALVSGEDGLDDIRRIVAAALRHLVDEGWLLLEHGYDQAETVRTLLGQGGFCDVFTAKDLAGIGRVSGGRFATKPMVLPIYGLDRP